MASRRLYHLVWHRSLWPAIAFSRDQCDTGHVLNTHVSDTCHVSGGHVSSDQGQSLILLSSECCGPGSSVATLSAADHAPAPVLQTGDQHWHF